MYTPKINQVLDRALLIEAMRANPFAILFGPCMANDPGGMQATHLPLVVKDEGEHGVLEGHFAKANPHWKSLSDQEVLVVFNGPHSYVSPSLYDEPLSVPTWNYIAVHASGILAVIDDDEEKDRVLSDLIEANEPVYADKWRQMPDGFRRTMLVGIMGFRVPIARIEGKFKLSQNRPETDRRRVFEAHASGDEDQKSLAAWMTRLSV